jgi:DNA adenine methylase
VGRHRPLIVPFLNITRATLEYFRRISPPAPLLRWAGSKRQLLPILLHNCPSSFRAYIEPFAGSACLFAALVPNRAILADFNLQLVDMYWTVRRWPDEVWQELNSLPPSADTYYAIRGIRPAQLSPVSRAARFIFLNRFSFNGVYRTNKRGQFNVPMGRKTGSIPSLSALQEWAKILAKAEIVDSDFVCTVRKANKNDFVYLDPPYSGAGMRCRGEYGNGAFSHSDLPSLYSELKRLDKIGAYFLLSYRRDEELLQECKAWSYLEVRARRHVAGFMHKRSIVDEVLVANYALR